MYHDSLVSRILPGVDEALSKKARGYGMNTHVAR